MSYGDKFRSVRKTATVDIEGLTVTLRELTAREADAWRQIHRRAESGDDAEVRVMVAMLVKSIIDDDGKLAFGDDQIEDAYDAMGLTAVHRLFRAALKLNGIDDAEGDDEGNADRGSGSSTSSAAN